MTLIISQLGLFAALTGLCEFFIGVWSVTLLLEYLFVIFLFLGGAWFNTFDFRFLGYLLLQGDHLLQESSMALQTTWYGPSFGGNVGSLTLFVSLPLEELLGLIKVLTELGRPDIPAVDIFFGC